MNLLNRRVALSVVMSLAGCAIDPVASSYEEGEGQDEQLLIALAWVGLYDGSGEVTVGADRQNVSNLVLRIALDADSLASGSCPSCLTVILDPWFARGNLQIVTGSEAALSYSEDGVVRSLNINRFSTSGQTANVLTVKLRHETVPVSGVFVRTLVDGDLEFRKR